MGAGLELEMELRDSDCGRLEAWAECRDVNLGGLGG